MIFGILTVVFCTAGFILAYRRAAARQYTAALLLMIISGAALRVFTATEGQLHQWDERYHALVAKNMMHQPLHPMLYSNPVLPYDYTDWTANHTWVHKQPLALWTMAGSLTVFGVNEFAVRLPSVLLSTAGIWIMYLIGMFLFGRRTGLIAAFLYAIHGLIVELTAGRVATDHIDVFFLFFIQLSVLFAILFFRTGRVYFNLLCGMGIGLAILSKWLPALIVLPVWLLLALDARRHSPATTFLHLLALCGVALAVALPWQIYIFRAFPLEAAWESSFNFRHLTEPLESHGRPFYYHLDKVRMIYGELIYLPMAWFFYKSFKNLRHYRRILISIWVIVPFVFFSAATTKMQAYTLFTAPALFLMTALFFQYLYRWRNAFRYRRVVVTVLILLLALPVRYAIERIKPFDRRDRNPAWAKELKALRGVITDESRVVVFNAERPVETMFYAGCTAYPGIPHDTTLTRLSQKGYAVFVRHDAGGGEAWQEADIRPPGHPDVVYRRWSAAAEKAKLYLQ